MAIDLAALRAKIAAQKAATPQVTKNENTSVSNEQPTTTNVVANSGSGTVVNNNSVNLGSTASSQVPSNEPVIPTVNPPEVLGTSKTSEIDHLDFISKMNSLSEAIHKQHPTMPVLLMQIHKQLRNDPELVTTLDEAAIGIVVKGLQVQTKTELVAEVVKKTTTRKKNSGVSLDML